jgi:arsenate reductase-like glutaredoxin family protein
VYTIKKRYTYGATGEILTDENGDYVFEWYLDKLVTIDNFIEALDESKDVLIDLINGKISSAEFAEHVKDYEEHKKEYDALLKEYNSHKELYEVLANDYYNLHLFGYENLSQYVGTVEDKIDTHLAGVGDMLDGIRMEFNQSQE